VWGVLFSLTPLQLALLDTLEWVPFGAYRRIKVSINTVNGEELEAYTYQARYPRANLLPSKIYLNSMIAASDRHDFPKEYREFLKRSTFGEKFELDHEFCLIAQGLTRHYPKALSAIVKTHDKLREKLCEII
jgi:hypothetical protein